MNEEQFSKEENEKMLLFLKEMKDLQESDPEAFNKLISSMSQNLNEQNSNEIKTKEIIESISQFKTQNEHFNSEITLPGGKETLSSDGIKNKVSFQILFNLFIFI